MSGIIEGIEKITELGKTIAKRTEEGLNAIRDSYGKMKNLSSSDIDQIAESIRDKGRFEYYYLSIECFRGKVNEIYKEILKEQYNDCCPERVSNVSEDDYRVYGALVVYNQRLAEAQEELKRCLEQLKSSGAPERDVDLGNLTVDTPDPTTPIISPFDRRLDRLVIDQNNAYPMVPISTAYAQSGTIGYTVSESYIRNSNAQKQDELVKKLGEDINRMQNDDYYVGVPSLMNNYAYVKLYGSKGGRYLINQKNQRKWYEVDQTVGEQTLLNISQNPTTSSIISWGNGDYYGRTPYNFTDFVFCKHWKKVQNNRMITLRRYPAPIVDNLKFPGMDGTQSSGTATEQGKESTASDDGGSSKKIMFPPMATAVTYFGEETDNRLSDILKFTTGFPWKEVEADVFKVTPTETPDSDKGPAGLWPGLSKIAKSLNVMTGDWNPDAVMNKGMLPPDPYQDGPYENRIIGPVNRITKVKAREAGIKFEMSGIELKFDYVARPIGGVNTKAVLLDILSNFLVIGSTSAVFWGGQHRFMGNPQTYPFIGGDKGMQQWYAGKPLAWGKSTIEEFVGKGAIAGSGLIDSAKAFFNGLLGSKPGCGTDLYAGIENMFTASKVPGNLVKQFAAEKSNGQIPYLTGLKALLIGEPVGEWHITVGNPLNPIAMIGNLICESVQVEFGNELGPDDFPLEMRVTVKLDHGMARDRDAIQSIFNRGMGRIYDLPDTFRGSAETETKLDKNSGNAPSTGRNPVYYKVPIANSGTVGGTFGTSKVVENSLQGSVSVWNRMKFTAMSPNSDQILRTKDNPLFRSSYRAVDWVALKSLK